jgi:hypothetical protein
VNVIVKVRKVVNAGICPFFQSKVVTGDSVPFIAFADSAWLLLSTFRFLIWGVSLRLFIAKSHDVH